MTKSNADVSAVQEALLTSLSKKDADAVERLLTVRLQRMPASDTTFLRRVLQDAERMYGAQMHWTGQALFPHVLSVLEYYLPFDVDDQGIAACILHHALDTKLWTLDALEHEYGEDIRSIIGAVHLLSRVSMHERRIAVEELRLMFLSVSHDMRTVLLVLCDHVQKLDMLSNMTPELRRRLCRDVLQLFAPVAARLGVYSLKQKLEAKAFPVVYPTDAARIAEQMEDVEKRFGNFLPDAAAFLQRQLAELGIAARVEGRQKLPYSIFQKMHGKSVTHIQSLLDLYALRVIVSDEVSCYQTLGVLHRIAHPVANRFKDYIGFPKPNGYRSLHTTMMNFPRVPASIVVEIQIRTEAMQREADLGIAAHWSYKQGRDALDAAKKAELQHALVERAVNQHIFVLTPRGDIIELSEGATPLDFAFGVHTNLGLCFKAARVNGAVVPIAHTLENGDIVEIIRRSEPKPSYNWLTVLKTASARSRLKRHLALADREGTIQGGREAVNGELERRHLPPLDPDLTVLRFMDGVALSFAERQELLLNIGRKAQTTSSLFRHADALQGTSIDQKSLIASTNTPENMRVAFNEGVAMPLRFALCCKADREKISPITGVVGRDGVIRIHKKHCAMIRNVDPGRNISVRWEGIGGQESGDRKKKMGKGSKEAGGSKKLRSQ